MVKGLDNRQRVKNPQKRVRYTDTRKWGTTRADLKRSRMRFPVPPKPQAPHDKND